MDLSDFASLTALATASSAGALTDRERQFIGLAVTLTRGCIACSGDRIARARASGISESAITQAVDLAAAVNAGVTVAIAMQGKERVAALAVESCAGACQVTGPR